MDAAKQSRAGRVFSALKDDAEVRKRVAAMIGISDAKETAQLLRLRDPEACEQAAAFLEMIAGVADQADQK